MGDRIYEYHGCPYCKNKNTKPRTDSESLVVICLSCKAESPTIKLYNCVSSRAWAYRAWHREAKALYEAEDRFIAVELKWLFG